ncbi:general secretion pathway protein H [Natronocella acetinitrilica]|uniref:Type II secretion system protein H n=1 Tax=Natronocella acetinitrilica TaxID=414046 RepID=A0AAE3G0C7_9GAMM|nr:type II secretion system minor pseudopilin GspH [Natronocella acetinitrilica]MCP1673035.1 general secretion pathway protein H [Natronocella acetinitrilica]
MLRSRGFTLIELLVVLLIIGIMVSVAILSVSFSRDDTLEREARRLQAVMELAAERALIEARELGLILEPDGYRFTELVDGQWIGITAAERREFNPREFPPQLRLQLELDGLPGDREPGASEDDRPSILMLSSGEMTPFRLLLSEVGGEQERYRLRGNLIGRLELERHDGDDWP